MYGTGGRWNFDGVEDCEEEFHAYPLPLPYFLPMLLPPVKSDEFITLIFCGGRGRKYRVYALARKLDMASRVGIKLDRLRSCGTERSAGARGRVVRRRV